MTDVLVSRCPICNTTKNLLLCKVCMAMPYCCRDHQLANIDDHKDACSSVKWARITLEAQEQVLRRSPPDYFTPANVFEDHVGHFWTIQGTRPYMRARYYLVDRLLQIKTFDAVKAAFDHTMDMFRLSRSDDLGLKFIAPSLFLRLGNDQQCYDFLKWHATTGSRNDYDWGDMSEPFLDLRAENVFEAVNEFTKEYAEVAHAAALMLIKMRLLKDAQTLRNSYFLYDGKCKLPSEIVDRIRKEAVGKIIGQRKDILMNKDQNSLIETLEEQIHQLFEFVIVNNKYVWPGLLDPTDYLEQLPTSFSYGSDEHAAVTIQYVYDAFVETPGSIEMIRKMLQKN